MPVRNQGVFKAYQSFRVLDPFAETTLGSSLGVAMSNLAEEILT